MTNALSLRSEAEALAAPMPPLLAQAEQLANTVILGDHGRRRAGTGDAFWQYRPAQPYDAARSIDWRRSARSDVAYVQDKEWQIAQSVMLWVDPSAAMQFRSKDDLLTKAEVARTLALATSLLLVRGGERVGLTGGRLPARRGDHQLQQMAQLLIETGTDDFGHPETTDMPSHSRAIFLSDFLGDITKVEEALNKAVDRGVQGALVQVLDPQEEAFPFDGRTVFQSMTGAIEHETLKAGNLRERYLQRLAERKEQLSHLARTTGWVFHTHHTSASATSALLWLYQAMERS